MLGAGLVEIPPVPYQDPAAVVLSDPQVPESKRFCSSCGEKVGRSRDGVRLGRAEGFCATCGTGFSFAPKLAAGDLVGGQYEVLGCLAHGGLGWIYLARDRNVNDRWVVLKGLLDSGDADAMAAAVAERRFLATVEHPNIVKIYNFVQHAGAGYIVMEYVGGRSLKDLRLEARHKGGALALPQVLAYGLEVLRAFGYLHAQGLLYCDFKPDNVIQTEEQLKLIDLGGVIGADDEDSPVYGTVGYQAPEIAEMGPSACSDLYTVGRTLAVLSFDFEGYTGRYRDSLPERDGVPVLAAHESFDRLLRRATDPIPERRYQSAEEMAEQITGVLREVLAAGDGQPRPGMSTLFGPEPRVIKPDAPDADDPAVLAAALPVPLIDTTDPAAPYLSGLAALAPRQIIQALDGLPVRSVETDLARARAHIDAGDLDAAWHALDALDDTGDWRAGWYRGIARLRGGEPQEARRLFDEVYGLLAGEAAPKLALAACAQAGADPETAVRCYAMVWRTDRSFLGAAFGLARAYLARGEWRPAVDVLESVPVTSSHYVEARLAAVRTRLRGGADLNHDDIVVAAGQLEDLELDPRSFAGHAIQVLDAALDRLVSSPAGAVPGAPPLLGAEVTERGIGFALERLYRALARLAPDGRERVAMVDRANAARPHTLI
jgi:serine/threonine-protein kinase PknG